MTRKKLNEAWESLRKIVKGRSIKCYTATQPTRPDWDADAALEAFKRELAEKKNDVV